MTRIALVQVLAAALIGLLAMPDAAAQTGSVAGIVLNRPSAQAPSSFVGLVGGLNTGRFGTDVRRNRSQLAPSPISTYNAFRGAQRGRAPDAYLPREVLSRDPARLGERINTMSFYGTRSANVARSPIFAVRRGIPSGAQLASLSGLAEVVSLDRPLGGRLYGDFGELRQLRTLARSTDEPVNVDRALGLAQPDSNEPRPVGATVAETIEARIALRLERSQKDACELFKQATLHDAPLRDDQLGAACRMLETVRSMDPKAHLAPLLIAHASLVRGRINVAIAALVDAANRNPEDFAKMGEVASYYGDRAVFDETMRIYVRIRSGSGESPMASALEAYCAMALGDHVRATSALDTAEKLENERMGGEKRSSALPLVHALRAAMRS
ncbi:hypothetical protein RAS1_43680 [Phycisphaerae bacterium RAS1]|nr:hypothetical protein RAS1_43680 [Phycisphaerae bacterium RAS1]